jgi:hypothetical protein
MYALNGLKIRRNGSRRSAKILNKIYTEGMYNVTPDAEKAKTGRAG